jgi:hypothetical protein
MSTRYHCFRNISTLLKSTLAADVHLAKGAALNTERSVGTGRPTVLKKR